MKKKQQHSNHNHPLLSTKTIDYLEKKYQDEKIILQKEIKKVETQLHTQIDKQNLIKLAFEKKQQKYIDQIDSLTMEMESLKNKILTLQEIKQPDQQQEEQQIKLLRAHKQVMVRNTELTHELQSCSEYISELQQKNKQLENCKEELQGTIDEQSTTIDSFKHQILEIEKNKNILLEECKYLKQSNQTLIENQKNISEYNSNLDSKVSQLKKKKKQLQKKVNELEQQIEQINSHQIPQLIQEISHIKQQKQLVEQTLLNNNTKIDFLNLSLKQKDSYIQKLQSQIEQIRKQQLIYEKQTTNKIEKIKSQYKKYQLQSQTQKNSLRQEINDNRKIYESEIIQLKKKIVEEVYNMLKGKDYYKAEKIMENFIGGFKSNDTPQKNNIKPLTQLNSEAKQPQQKYQKINQESHTEIFALKRNNELLNSQLSSFKKMVEEYKCQLENKTKSIQQLVQKKQKIQKSLNSQILQLRNQIISLKNKQTQLLELKKQKIQFQNTINMRISVYEKKYRDLLENIERKQSLIKKLKKDRSQESKLIQQKLNKIVQQSQNLKKLKADSQRKDDLTKQYKNKLQKLKNDIQNLRTQNQNIKKQKARIQKNLQSKQQYISTLKSKYEKQTHHLQELEKQIKLIKQKQNKNGLESKNRKLKKQCSQYSQVLEEIKQIINIKVSEKLSKTASQSKDGKHEWEGAKLLGLKANQIQQFINPLARFNKNISNDLENLWQRKNYKQFIETSLQYLTLQN